MSGSSAHPVDVLLGCLLELCYPIDQFDIEGLRAICDAPADPVARRDERGIWPPRTSALERRL